MALTATDSGMTSSRRPIGPFRRLGSGRNGPLAALPVILAMIILAATSALQPAASLAVESDPGGRFIFSGTVGGGHVSPKVLLRWVAADRPSPYSSYLLKRRAASDASLSDLAVVEPLTDPAAIEAVFPIGSEIRDEVTELIVPGLGPTLGAAFLALRADPDPAGKMQHEMLRNTNYGVAIADGLAYLDTGVADGTRYSYELWGLDPVLGVPVERLGKVWVKAGEDTALPAPEELVAARVADVDMPPVGNFPEPADGDIDLDGDGKLDGGEFGDGKIYLKWERSADPEATDRETGPTGFGYDIVRLEKGALPVCDPIPPAGAVQVNEEPVVPLSGLGQDRAEEGTVGDMPDFFFVDDNSNDAIPPIVKGTEYCYWVVARTFLREPGGLSAPAVACAPDLGVPRQVRDVATAASPVDGITVSWSPNESDPVTLGSHSRYIDDTDRYHVYRFTEFDDLLMPPSGPPLCDIPATETSCVDPEPALANNRGRIYWYAVTAVDAPVCGNPSNESAYSAPARGVVYDEEAPTIVSIEPFCEPDPEAEPPCPPPSGSKELPCLRRCCTGPQCPPDDDDDDVWCDNGGAKGIFPRPCDRWGYRVPNGGTDPDTMSVRLYRGTNGADFLPVEEGFFTPAADAWEAVEGFRTRMAQKFDYRLRPLDRDSNIGDVADPGISAYAQGTAPPPRPTIVGSTFDPDAAEALVRWHAPAAEALAGFRIRTGPALRLASASTTGLSLFAFLPAANDLASEESLGPGADVDGDGTFDEPDLIIIKSSTQYLADLGPDLGGLRAGDGYLEYTLPVAAGTLVEIVAIDIAGQLSPPATTIPKPLEVVVLDELPWPQRDEPLTFALGVAPEDVAVPTRVELCWDRAQKTDPVVPFVHPEFVAVFRAVVEPGRPEGFQQRSPRLDIDSYVHVPGSELECTGCRDELIDALGGGAPGDLVCWWDHGIVPGETYRYTVLGFSGPPVDPAAPPPNRNPAKRDEGEIDAIYGDPPVEITVP